MDRLSILAAYCPKDLDVSDSSNLNSRGANIFLANEPDSASANLFLFNLLNYIREWAEQYPNDGAADTPSMFAKVYEDLGNKQVAFPAKNALGPAPNRASRQTEVSSR